MATPIDPPPPPPPPSIQLSSPVAVVGPGFCLDYPLDLTVTQKALSLSDGDYAVTDIYGNIHFRVRGKSLSLRGKLTLVDTARNTILTMRGKLMSMHDRWKIFKGDSIEEKDVLFSVKKSKLIQFKTNLDVFLAANTSEEVCDFKVRGNRHDRSVTIFLGDSDGIIIAQMKEEYSLTNTVLGKDMFAVTVYPKVDYAFVAALVVILDDIDHSEGD